MKGLNIQISLQVLSPGHTERCWANHLPQIAYERGTSLDFSPSSGWWLHPDWPQGEKKSHWDKQNKKANRGWEKQRQLKKVLNF